MEPEPFGPYKLIKHLATGGMGELYLAECDRADLPGSSKQVVIKRIRQELVDDPIFVRSFLDEGRIASLITHPNIVRIHSMDQIDGAYYMAMEYVDGKDLESLLAATGGPLDLSAALHVMDRLCAGLGYAHDTTGPWGQPLGLVHRDINPQNVLCGHSGEVKLTDFGIAKVYLEHRERTRTGIIKGKFGYMAPEQAKGVGVDRRCDIYSLGLLLFEMTTGQQAVCGKTDQQKIFSALHGEVHQPEELIPAYPAELGRIYRKATAVDPAGRYQAVGELQEDLHVFCAAQRLQVGAAALAEQMRQSLTEQREVRRAEEAAITSTPPRRTPSEVLLGDASTASASDLRPIPMEEGPDDAELDAPEPVRISHGGLAAAPTALSEIQIDEPTRQDSIRRVFQPAPTGPAPTGPAVLEEAGPALEPEPMGGGDGDPEKERPSVPEEEPTQLGVARVSLLPAVGSVEPRPDANEHAPEPESPRETPKKAKIEEPRGAVEPSAGEHAAVRDRMEPVHELTEAMRAPPRASHRRRLAIVVSLALLVVFCLVGMAYQLAQRGREPKRRGARRAPVVQARVIDKRVAARPAGPARHAKSPDAAVAAHKIEASGRPAANIATAHGLLRLTVTPPVSVLWNKRPLGQTPLEAPLPPGKHRLFLRSKPPNPDDEVRLLRGVKIDPQETTVLDWKLARGRLEIQAEPPAQVKINGRERGNTPLTLELYEGVCQVRLLCSQSQESYQKVVTISPGKTSRLVHRFGESGK